jgi:DsbC/DsbD-like thiol-disulfide interchange protein
MLVTPFPLRRIAGTLAAAWLVSVANNAVYAADASAWDRGSQSAVRLIAGMPLQTSADRILRAGIEMKLAPGWKTYWRHPGDSGVPPRFDFAGSENVKDIQVLWPAPVRFADGGGMSVGYVGAVVLPLRVLPANAQAPTTVRLKLDYAVCEKLCVPEEATLELMLDTSDGSHEAALRANEARVPKPATIGATAVLAVTGVRRERGPKPQVVVDVKAPRGAEIDLFAEGPTSEWSLPLPAPVAAAPDGMQRFAFELDGLPPGVEPQGADLTLTLVSAADAIEVTYHID